MVMRRPVNSDVRPTHSAKYILFVTARATDAKEEWPSVEFYYSSMLFFLSLAYGSSGVSIRYQVRFGYGEKALTCHVYRDISTPQKGERMQSFKWSPEEAKKAQLSAANLRVIEKASQSYNKEQDKAARELKKELDALEKFSNAYSSKLMDALARMGIDVKAVQAEHKKITEEQNPKVRLQRSNELIRKYEPSIRKALASLGIDEAALQEKLMSVIAAPSTVQINKYGPLGLSWVQSVKPQARPKTSGKRKKTTKEK